MGCLIVVVGEWDGMRRRVVGRISWRRRVEQGLGSLLRWTVRNEEDDA